MCVCIVHRKRCGRTEGDPRFGGQGTALSGRLCHAVFLLICCRDSFHYVGDLSRGGLAIPEVVHDNYTTKYVLLKKQVSSSVL